MNMLPRILIASLLTLAITITGCGGGGGGGGDGTIAGIGGTGRIASGPITAFGSIFVNNVEYKTGSASIEVNGLTGRTQADLAIGMIVTVTGTVNDDGLTGTAESVVFDNDVKGPISGLVIDGNTRHFSILGTTVVVDSTSTSFDDDKSFGFTDLADDIVVEVSGFQDASGTVHATWVEKKDDTFVPGKTKVELKGTVSSNIPGISFQLDGITIQLDVDTDLSDLPGGISNGLSVEVKGILMDASTVQATRIELESEGLGDEVGDASIEGLVTDYKSNSDFRVNGQKVDASSATIKPSSVMLRNGLGIEVEGPITNGALIADKIEIRSGDIKIESTVDSVSTAGKTLTFSFGGATGTVTVTINSSTELEDDTGGSSTLSLADIRKGDFLKVRGLDDGSGSVIAARITRDKEDDTILQGPLDSSTGTSVTVLGVIFSTGVDTSFEDSDDDELPGASAFFDLVKEGDTVKITDEDGDGTAEQVDQEDEA